MKSIKHQLIKIARRFMILSLMITVAQQASAYTFVTSLDDVETGYYRVYSQAYDITMAMSEATMSHNVFCDTPDANKFIQVWKVTVSNPTATTKDITLENVVTGLKINRSSGNFHTHQNAMLFLLEFTGSGFTIAVKNDPSNGLHHQQVGHDVVSYGKGAAASKWQLEKVTIDDEELAAQRTKYEDFSDIVNRKATITTALKKYFTDGSCSELQDTYKSYTDDQLQNAMTDDNIPQICIDMAKKVKNNSWAVYQDGWSINEKSFRVASYKPMSKGSLWRSLTDVGYALSPNSDPTGIAVQANDILSLYVGGDIPSTATLTLRDVEHYSASGDGYTLVKGLNIIEVQKAGLLFIDYEVDNTTGGKAPFTSLSSYSNLNIHIEGGSVNGCFDITRGHTDADWVIMKDVLFKEYDYLQLRGTKLLFNMNKDLVIAACPEKMKEVLEIWDDIVGIEHGVMGLDEFDGFFNTSLMAVSMTGGYMYASTYGTYYNESTLSTVMNYDKLFSGSALWGPAHENGHIHQKTFNMIGQSEVSNNLFSNVVIYHNGHHTSREEYISTTFQNMADGKYWLYRGIWERTHLYFQLYQFFHIQGYKSDFYPKLFQTLREDPMRSVQKMFIDATDDYLKFYKKACEVSGYDLTELFQAYGFFIIPAEGSERYESFTLNGVTQTAFHVTDYGEYYIRITQDMINDAIAYVKSKNLKKCNIVFIEDRVSAPDATYSGATSGEKKTGLEYAIGKGDVGQYTDFLSDVGAQGYAASYTENANGGLDVFVNTQNASGAVGFKVYDANENLVYLSNTYSFTIPTAVYDKIKGTDFKIEAAGADGNDQQMEAANHFIEWVIKDKSTGNVIKRYAQTVFVNQAIEDYPSEIKKDFVVLPTFESFTYTEPVVKNIEADIITPFQVSDETTGRYYYIKVRNGYLVQTVSNGVSVPTLTTTKIEDDKYRWSFYGNPYDGYRIRNLATGQWLYAGNSFGNGVVPQLDSQMPTNWTINYYYDALSDRIQFQLAVPGRNTYLNDYGGKGTKVAYYGNASSITVETSFVLEMPVVNINVDSHLASFSYPRSFTVPDDVNIFIATQADDNSVQLLFLDTKVVPAETGVLLYSADAGEKILTLGAFVDSEVSDIYNENIFKGTSDVPYTVTAAQNIYALYSGKQAFAKVKTGVTIPKQKAYLEVTSEQAAKMLNLNFGGTSTGIIKINTDDKYGTLNSPLYNVNGQRVSRYYKGVVIKKGKKIIQR